MALNPVGIAVPIFFLLMAIEVAVAWKQKKNIFRLNDSVANLGCGIGDQLIGIFSKFFTLGIYTWFFEHYAVFTLDTQNPWVWGVGFLLVDFCYYWYHRESHLVALFWTTHSVHHQSEEYNLSVALRQSWFAKFFSWMFYIPLAIFGFPPIVFLLSYSINLFYQFWIHTTLIHKLGVLEWFFNTPSHHRVHHGTNEQYLDKNYAGVFIIWDRIFGSFQAESDYETTNFGVLSPIASWNPIYVNVYPIQKLLKRAFETKDVTLCCKTLFNEPAWLAPHMTAGKTHPFGYNADAPKTHLYSMIQLTLVTIIMTIVLTFSEYIIMWFLIPLVLCTITIPITISGYLEQKKWALPAELIRNLGLFGILLFNPYPSYFALGIGIALTGLICFIVWGRSK